MLRWAADFSDQRQQRSILDAPHHSSYPVVPRKRQWPNVHSHHPVDVPEDDVREEPVAHHDQLVGLDLGDECQGQLRQEESGGLRSGV